MDNNKPWLNEPDQIYWEEKGLRCFMLRNSAKTWCGYVEIPKGHPYYDLGCYEINDKDGFPNIHGGITFMGEADFESLNIDCRVVGFDCSHAFDVIPMLEEVSDIFLQMKKMREEHELWWEGVAKEYIKPTYKDMEFVKKEITKLVDHIIEVIDKEVEEYQNAAKSFDINDFEKYALENGLIKKIIDEEI